LPDFVDLLFVEIIVVTASKFPLPGTLPVAGRYAEGDTVIFQQVDFITAYRYEVGFKRCENVTIGKTARDGLQGRTNKLDYRMPVQRFSLIDKKWYIIIVEIRLDVMLVSIDIRLAANRTSARSLGADMI